MNPIKKILIIILQKTEALSALSCRLARLTGKSKFNIHPKHLVKTGKPWYLKYINKKDSVLDVGCGNGEHTFKMAKICKKVAAFDIDEKALKQASKKQRQARIKNIKLLTIDANKKFPFEDSSFNLVVALDVLEHLRNYKKTTKEIIRVLKKDGLFLLTLPNKETSWKKLKKEAGQFCFSDRRHIREWMIEEIKKFPKEFDLKLVTQKPIVYDTPFIGFIDLLGGVSLFSYKKLLRWKRKKALEFPEESTGFSLVLRKNK